MRDTRGDEGATSKSLTQRFKKKLEKWAYQDVGMYGGDRKVPSIH